MTDELHARIERNLGEVRERMAAAAARAGRDPAAVTLVAVTKEVGVEAMSRLCTLGVRHLGENRVHVAGPKFASLDAPVVRHMIGYVQRRKAKSVVELFDTVDSLDRLELAEVLEKRCAEAGKRLDVLMEVNVSGEAQKHGLPLNEAPRLLEQTAAFGHLRVRGLMTMAPLGADEAALRRIFACLRSAADALGLPECSMGMTDDFEVAIEEGATQVRIGRALFE